MTLEELKAYHDEDIRKLISMLESNADFQESIRVAFQAALGIDITSPQSIVKFHDEHRDLLEQRSKLVKMQILLGRTLISGIISLAAYFVIKAVDLGLILIKLGVVPPSK